MLQEIFKGMDNAAEQINENFLLGSVVADNLNESNPPSGYYVRFGNGFQVCYHTIDVTAITSYRADRLWRYAKEFNKKPVVIPVKPWFIGGGAGEADYSITARNEAEFTTESVSISVFAKDRTLTVGNVLSNISVVEVGRWK